MKKDNPLVDFGKPYIMAEAHGFTNLKNADGASLDTIDHTLTGKDIEYVADVTHVNMWRELAKKLPMFLRAKWTECTGKIIDSGRRPRT